MSAETASGHIGLLREEMRAARADMAGLRQDIQAILPRIASLEATLEQANDRTRSEIDVLFQKHADHEERLAGVEKNYWPRPAQERFEDRLTASLVEQKRDRERAEAESKKAINELGVQVRLIGVKVAGIAGGIGVVSALIQFFVGSYLKGHA